MGASSATAGARRAGRPRDGKIDKGGTRNQAAAATAAAGSATSRHPPAGFGPVTAWSRRAFTCATSTGRGTSGSAPRAGSSPRRASEGHDLVVARRGSAGTAPRALAPPPPHPPRAPVASRVAERRRRRCSRIMPACRKAREPLPETVHGAVQAALHGAQAEAQRGGDLFEAHLLVVAQDEDGALGLGQALHGPADAIAELPREGATLGRMSSGGQALLVVALFEGREARPAALVPTVAVDRLVDRDPREPGRDSAAPSQRAACSKALTKVSCTTSSASSGLRR